MTYDVSSGMLNSTAPFLSVCRAVVCSTMALSRKYERALTVNRSDFVKRLHLSETLFGDLRSAYVLTEEMEGQIRVNNCYLSNIWWQNVQLTRVVKIVRFF